MLKLVTLPIVEQWDCHHCTACCRETTIPLTANDLARLEKQQWERHPDYRGVRTIRRTFGSRQPVLAHRADGSCVFLTASGRCRIHEEFGADAKPLMCQQFPLQIVATDRGACATVRRSCPSAAADRGQPLERHLPGIRRVLRDQRGEIAAGPAPPILKRINRGWDEFHCVADALARLVADERMPLVRRIVHGLRFCSMLEECKWNKVDAASLHELVMLLEEGAPGDVGSVFQERRPPTRSVARLFRRLGAHFIRCAPGGQPTRTWLDRMRAMRQSGRLSRARRVTPGLHPAYPRVPLERLERPLGPLGADLLRPLNRFFETHAASKQFVFTEPRTSLVGSFRRLAFTLPMAFWMLRWRAADREPTGDDVVEIVVALERGYVLPALNPAANYLAASGELERLIAWYGR